MFFSRTRAQYSPLSFLLAHLAKAANGGDLEHVGVIVRHPQHHYPYVLERTWRGPQLTGFEDRVLHSSSSDIMVRSVHFLRSHHDEAAAQQFVAEQLAEQARLRSSPLSLIAQWGRDACGLIFAALAHARLPRAAPPVRRVVDMEELARLSGGAGGDGDEFGADGGAGAGAGAGADFMPDGGGAKVAGNLHISNRAAMAGELAAAARQLRAAEAEIKPLAAAASASAAAAATASTKSGAAGTDKAAKNVSGDDGERLLLLLKRRRFLAATVRLASLTLCLKFFFQVVCRGSFPVCDPNHIMPQFPASFV